MTEFSTELPDVIPDGSYYVLDIVNDHRKQAIVLTVEGGKFDLGMVSLARDVVLGSTHFDIPEHQARHLLMTPERPYDRQLDGPLLEPIPWHEAYGRLLPDGSEIYRVWQSRGTEGPEVLAGPHVVRPDDDGLVMVQEED